MIEGTKKMEEDAKEGRDYSSGIRLHEDNEAEGENRPRKKRQTKDNNQLTTTAQRSSEGCRCGGVDHKQISSLKCPWKGMSKSEVSENYAQRQKEKMKETAPTSPTNPTPGASECEPMENRFEGVVNGLQLTSE
jgi:hypothetical protein